MPFHIRNRKTEPLAREPARIAYAPPAAHAAVGTYRGAAQAGACPREEPAPVGKAFLDRLYEPKPARVR